MDNLKEVSKITFQPQGWIIGLRTWVLKAYDEKDNEICTIDNNERHNYIKYVKFIVALKKKGYKLRKCDRVLLKSGKKKFLIKSFISYAKKNDFYEIANIAGYDNDYVDNIKTKSEPEQRVFGEMVGLEYDELKLLF